MRGLIFTSIVLACGAALTAGERVDFTSFTQLMPGSTAAVLIEHQPDLPVDPPAPLDPLPLPAADHPQACTTCQPAAPPPVVYRATNCAGAAYGCAGATVGVQRVRIMQRFGSRRLFRGRLFGRGCH